MAPSPTSDATAQQEERKENGNGYSDQPEENPAELAGFALEIH